MNEIHFEWNKLKSAANKRKHGVSFEEAKTVFYDDDAILYDDPDHSKHEERFIMLGMSYSLRVLVVSHCERHDNVVRIISARKALRHEVHNYMEGRI